MNLILNQQIKWPATISPNFKAFLNGLLDKNPSTRLCWPFVLKHPYIRGDNTEVHSGDVSIDVIEELQESAMLSKRIDSAIVLPTVTIKESPRPISRSVSIQDLVLQDDCDWHSIKSKINNGTIIFTKEVILEVLTAKMIASGENGGDFMIRVDIACLLSESVIKVNKVNACDQHVQKSLKQIFTWMLNSKKSYLAINQSNCPEFDLSFNRFIVSCCSILKPNQNDSKSNNHFEWIPTIFAQTLLPTALKQFKNKENILPSIVVFQTFIQIINAYGIDASTVYLRDILDLELVKEMFQFVLTNDLPDLECSMQEVLNLSQSILEFPLTSHTELLKQEIIQNFEQLSKHGNISVVKSIVLDSETYHTLLFNLSIQSNIFILNFYDKHFIQSLLNSSASDQVSSKIRSESVSMVCHIYQTLLDTELKEWVRMRMKSLLESVDPLINNTMKTSPSKTSFIFKSFSSGVIGGDGVSLECIGELKYCLCLDEFEGLNSCLLGLFKIFARGAKDESTLDVYCRDDYTNSDDIVVRIISLIEISAIYLDNPILLKTTKLDIGGMIKRTFGMKFGVEYQKSEFQIYIERFSGISVFVDTFLQSIISVLYIQSLATGNDSLFSVSLDIMKWIHYSKVENTSIMLFGYYVVMLKNDPTLIDIFVSHAIQNKSQHQMFISRVVAIESDKRVQSMHREFKELLSETTYPV